MCDLWGFFLNTRVGWELLQTCVWVFGIIFNLTQIHRKSYHSGNKYALVVFIFRL